MDDLHIDGMSASAIASWQLLKASTLVPVEQCELRWNAAQVEVLWNFLLKGQPIGAITLQALNQTQRFELHKQYKRQIGGILLDGFQRANAITLGFRPFPNPEGAPEKQKKLPVLWLDLLTQREEESYDSPCEYVFYLTTLEAPCGDGQYDGNKAMEVAELPLDDPRIWDAKLVCCEETPELLEDEEWRPYPCDLYPVCAKLPIPVSLLTDAIDKGKEGFWDAVKEGVQKLQTTPWHRKHCDALEAFFESPNNEIMEAFIHLEDEEFQIPCVRVHEDMAKLLE